MPNDNIVFSNIYLVLYVKKPLSIPGTDIYAVRIYGGLYKYAIIFAEWALTVEGLATIYNSTKYQRVISYLLLNPDIVYIPLKVYYGPIATADDILYYPRNAYKITVHGRILRVKLKLSVRLAIELNTIACRRAYTKERKNVTQQQYIE